MASKYKRGRRIISVSDYEISTKLHGHKMFWIELGKQGYIRHIGWIESWQYRTLKNFIESGFIYEAELKEKENDS